MDKEEESGRQCPFGHKLHLRTDILFGWGCDGAIIPNECLSGSNSPKDGKTPRFRCLENCNFDLCDVCFHSEKVEKPVEAVIFCMRRLQIQYELPIPPFSEKDYKEVVYLSGHVDVESQCDWLLNNYKQGGKQGHKWEERKQEQQEQQEQHQDREKERGKEDECSRQCPFGHPLQLQTDSLRMWRCRGAIVPGECLSSKDAMIYGGKNPRFRCVENCDFDLCDDCFHCKELVEKRVEELILYIRRLAIEQKTGIPSFSINTYKKVVYLSANASQWSQWNWLLDKFQQQQKVKQQQGQQQLQQQDKNNDRQCPFGHLMQLQTTDAASKLWLCDGAVIPHECLSGKNSMKDEKNMPRFQCVENCLFELCDICFHSEESVEKPMKELICHLWQFMLKTKQVIPPFSLNAYKRAVYVSGCRETERQFNWLVNEFNRLNPNFTELNSPIFISGDTFDETLLYELIQIGAGFTENAYKRALFFSGNKNAQEALEWLCVNEDDPCLNLPVAEKVKKCSKAHCLVPLDVNTTETKAIDDDNGVERWICDEEDSFEECKMTTENYLKDHPKIIKRYTCKKNCKYDICDSCLLAPKSSKKHQIKQQYQPSQLQLQQLPLQLQPQPPQPAPTQPPLPPPPPKQPHLQQHHDGYLTNLNSPICIRKDTYDETLLNELTQSDPNQPTPTQFDLTRRCYTKNAYKRALFFSGNTNVEDALEWLRKNSEDPCLNLPVSNDVAKCPEGHSLILSDEKEKRWICDKEVSDEGCKREMTIENYRNELKDEQKNIKMYVCKETNCRYNICDSCLLIPKSSQEHVAFLPNEQQEEKTPPSKFTYQFVNLNNNPKRSFFTNLQHWVDKIKAETLNAEVVSHHQFKSILNAPPYHLAKAAMNKKIPGKDHYFHHRYIILGLEDMGGRKKQNKNKTKSFLSIEKDQTGILAQLHDNYDQVKNYHLGVARSNLEEIDFKDLTSINRLEYINLPRIGEILEMWEITSNYNLWKSNCQTLTRYVREQIVKVSNTVELHLPGTNKKASINDSSKMLSYMESRFPNWRKKNLVRIPELQIQYAMKIGQDGSQFPALAMSDEAKDTAKIEEEILKKEYDELVVKQNGFEGICKALNGKAFSNDKKVIFFNLNRDKVEQTMNDETLRKGATAESRKIPEIISDFWKSSFEFLSITSKHGIFIFQYDNSEISEEACMDEKKTLTEMRNKADILRDLGQFKEKCITSVSIRIHQNDVKPQVTGPQEMEYGNHFHLKVSKTNVTHDLKFCMKVLTRKIGKLPKNSKLKKKLKNLVVRLTILQNIENETNLVHHKLETQEWGKLGVMLWSEAQRACIEKGRKSFQGKEKPLRLILRGCQGSGKTLVLIRLARDFVLSHGKGLVVIQIAHAHEKLICELRAVVERDELLRDRVVVGYFNNFTDFVKTTSFDAEENNQQRYIQDTTTRFVKTTSLDAERNNQQQYIRHVGIGSDIYPFFDIASVGAICYDETLLTNFGFLKADLAMMHLLLPTQHLILATSRHLLTAEKANEACKSVDLDFSFQEMTLEGNFRSTPTISNFTAAYQVLSTAGSANIPVKTMMDFSSPRPKIIAQEFPPDRNDFLHLVINEIQNSMSEHGNADIVVLTLCHSSLREKMKEMWKNKLEERVIPEEDEERGRKEDEKGVIFAHSQDVLGCQFPVVIMVIDYSTIFPNHQDITNALTRATATVTCLVNTSLEPLKIDGHVSFFSVQCSPSYLSTYLETLAEKFSGDILVYDQYKLVSKEIQCRLDARRFDFEWNRQHGICGIDCTKRTKTATVLVEVVPPMVGSNYSRRAHCPIIELFLKDKDDRDSTTTMIVQNYDKYIRKPIHDFFIKAAKQK